MTIDNPATLLLDVPKVAARISVSERLVKKLIQTGELPSVKLASRRLVHVADLEAFAERLRDGENEQER